MLMSKLLRNSPEMIYMIGISDITLYHIKTERNYGYEENKNNRYDRPCE